MGKISVKKRMKRYIVTNKLLKMEQINQRELHFLARECPKGILTPVAQEKKKPSIFCEVIAAVPLSLLAKQPVTRKRFFEYVQQIVEVICFCDANKLDTRNLMLDIDHIFATRQTGLIYLVYWPVVNATESAEAYKFFKSLTTAFVFDSHEPLEYVTEYANFFKTHELFSLTQFIRFISDLSGNPINVPTDSFLFEEKGISQSLTGETRRSTTGGIYVDAIYSPLGADNTSAGIGNKAVAATGAKPISSPESATTILSSATTPEANAPTTVLRKSFPVLTRQATGERVLCNSNCLRIGKTPGFCDYVVEGNPAISKHHANIIFESDGQYYLVDCNSTNGSYLEGIAVLPGQKSPIKNQSQLQLADEIFLFSME